MYVSSITELADTDPSLYRAVRAVMWEGAIASLDITMEEWRAGATREVRRLAKIRASLPLPDLK